MSPATPNEQRLLDAIVAHATRDRAFRQELLAEPRRAISGAFGVQIPNDYRVRFIERDPSLDALVVLPDLADSDGELSDAELEAASGGGDPNPGLHWTDPGT